MNQSMSQKREQNQQPLSLENRMNASLRSHSNTCQLLWLLIFFVFSVSGKNVALAQQRYQAMSLSFLTELPERDGTNVPFASEQKPNKGELKVSNEARITPPFAYDRSDQYLAPDFNSFFPDDPAGGKQLDALFSGTLGGHHKPEDVSGCDSAGAQAHSGLSQSSVGTGRWIRLGRQRAKPASDRVAVPRLGRSRVRGTYEGMYYGLTVLKDRPPNVVRTLVNNYDSITGGLMQATNWSGG